MPWLTGILRIQNTGALSLRLTLCASFLLGLVTDSKCVAAKHRKTIIDHSIPRFRALTPEDSHMSAIKLNEEQQQAVERCESLYSDPSCPDSTLPQNTRGCNL